MKNNQPMSNMIGSKLQAITSLKFLNFSLLPALTVRTVSLIICWSWVYLISHSFIYFCINSSEFVISAALGTACKGQGMVISSCSVCFEMGTLCRRPSCPGTHQVDQADSKLRVLCLLSTGIEACRQMSCRGFLLCANLASPDSACQSLN